MIVELIAFCVRDVRDAVRCGADRIELVTGMAEGGLTPSAGLIEEAVAAAGRVPVQVMIRPHAQSFVYDEDDVAVMLRDISLVRSAGAGGIVLGPLTSDGVIDVALLERLLAAADGLSVTFHRAFDMIADQLSALQSLARYPQIDRILTSGGPQPAPQAASRIRELVQAAAGTNLRILAGHGLKPEGLGEFVRATGVTEVHFGSAVRADSTFATNIDEGKLKHIRDELKPQA